MFLFKFKKERCPPGTLPGMVIKETPEITNLSQVLTG
jgi:hypothetical protein